MRHAILFLCLATAMVACQTNNDPQSPSNTPVHSVAEQQNSAASSLKDYWYAGDAELTSYHLKQARYGEIREGDAVVVFVTEPFSKSKQVKLDGPGGTDEVQVLKMNQTRSFNTGIYPYSMMTSVFTPMDGGPAIKTTTSSQEWCGHTWTQLNLVDDFTYRFEQRSYFESEGDVAETLPQGLLEDDLWSSVRLDPLNIPSNMEVELIPSTQFLRLRHLPVKPYKATLTKQTGRAGESMIHVEYTEIERTLTLFYATEFPHTIKGWEETYRSGYGPGSEVMTTTAKLNKRIKAPYWNLNSNADASWRAKLGLD